MVKGARPCARMTKLGNPCGQPAMHGRPYCRKHGGKALAGIANPSYGLSPITAPGHYSKYIPQQLQTDYTQAQRDPERLSLLHEISAWTAREQELLKRLTPHDPGSTWATVDTAWQQIEDAKAALDTATQHKDMLGMRQAYARFHSALATGRSAITTARADYGLWQEIKAVHQMLLALRAQEHKRLLELQRYWNSEQVASRWSQFLHALWEACMHSLPREQVRPLLLDFQRRIRDLDADFVAMQRSAQGMPMPPVPSCDLPLQEDA